jgi:hypothetical protein
MQALLSRLADSPWQDIDVSVREKANAVASKPLPKINIVEWFRRACGSSSRGSKSSFVTKW